MNKWLCAFVSVLLLAVGVSADAADKKKSGGLIGNSYGSQMELISDSIMRVTTRKKVQGTLDEITTPGTSTYNAFNSVQNAAVVRAAVEARNLGFKALKVSGTRNLSSTSERRSASSCPGGICESDFTFAKGSYSTDVELAIELTFDLLKEVPAEGTGVVDVEAILKQFGL
ncbi:MAG: hypothetical protein QM808_17950 [Steroidobacteraceae bacterium]